MHLEQPGARIGYRGSALSRVKQLALKSLVVVGGAVMLASVFLVSIALVAVGLVIVLAAGGYFWWQTRALRRQMRTGMQAQSEPEFRGRVIEGEVISRGETTGRRT